MKKTGASLVRHALEQLGVRFTFGIPGVHNTEIYDELAASEQISPLLVTHEAGAAFMADAVSRTSDSIGTLVVVPAAGLTHAMSGVGEAFLDGIPMLVISGGTRTDTGRAYQLHQMDQQALMATVSKAQFKCEAQADIVPTLYEAHRIATTGEPGPVYVEIPVNIQMLKGEAGEIPDLMEIGPGELPSADDVESAATMLVGAKRVGIFAGWGAVRAAPAIRCCASLNCWAPRWQPACRGSACFRTTIPCTPVWALDLRRYLRLRRRSRTSMPCWPWGCASERLQPDPMVRGHHRSWSILTSIPK